MRERSGCDIIYSVKTLAAAVLLISICHCLSPSATEAGALRDASSVRAFVASMSVEEKAGQMLMVGFGGPAAASAVQMIREIRPGGVILFSRNLQSEEQIVSLTSGLQAESRRCSGIEMLIATDQEGGRVSRLLPPICPPLRSNAELAKSGGLSAVRQQAVSTAAALKRVGINMNLAPVLDVWTDPANKVIGDRSYSSDPQKVSELGQEYVRTLQSLGVLATVKHFPGHGPTPADSHKELPVVELTAGELDRIHTMPFAQVISRVQPAAVMTAHIVYPELDSRPATMSSVIINDTLRARLGFGGLVITDGLEMDALRKNYTVREIVLSSVNAGVDMLLVSHDQRLAREVRATIIGLVRRGAIPESRLNSAVENVLMTKVRFGICK